MRLSRVRETQPVRKIGRVTSSASVQTTTVAPHVKEVCYYTTELSSLA